MVGFLDLRREERKQFQVRFEEVKVTLHLLSVTNFSIFLERDSPRPDPRGRENPEPGQKVRRGRTSGKTGET